MSLSRRHLFGAAALASLAGVTSCAKPYTPEVIEGDGGKDALLENLRIHTPKTLAFSAPTTGFGTHGLLKSGLVGKVSLDYWVSMESLQSLITSDATDFVAVPMNVGANLYNKGVDLKLAAAVVWGMLYVIGPANASKDDLGQLKGKKIGVPYPNNMPDIVFRYLLKESGLSDKDVEIVSFPTGQELMSTFVKGDLEWALLPEHAMSVALMKSKKSGREVSRAIDLQQVWANVTGLPARFPMAGIAVPGRIAKDTKLMAGLFEELTKSVAQVNSASDETIAEINKRTGVPAPIIKQVIPRLQLNAVVGAEAKDDISDLFTRLATLNPKFIGGKVPDADFFLADPR